MSLHIYPTSVIFCPSILILKIPVREEAQKYLSSPEVKIVIGSKYFQNSKILKRRWATVLDDLGPPLGELSVFQEFI